MRDSVLLLTIFCGLAAAQSTPPAKDEKPASVAGVVTDALSGQPIPRAHVSIEIFTSTMPRSFTALSKADGSFSISDIPPGEYSLSARHTGFVRWPTAQTRLAVRAGHDRADVAVKLMPAGAITGRVLDADGQPMEFVNVVISGSPASNANSNATTDDNGRFRIGGLPPGKYRVQASPREFPFPAEIRTDGTKEAHYSATYYPGSLDRKSAVRVEVQPGVETNSIDIHMVPTPIVCVSGTVSGFPEGEHVQVLPSAQQASGGFGARSDQAKPDGTFQIWRLAPGKYRLIAMTQGRERVQSAPVYIEVAGSNIEHLELKMVPPSDIPGVLEFDDDQARQPLEPPPGGPKFPPQPLRIGLTPLDYGGSQQPVEVAPVNTFTMKRLQPGRYRISVNRGGVYVKSLRLGTVEMDGDTLDLTRGSSGATLTILLSSAIGSMSGTVQNENGPLPNAPVYLIRDNLALRGTPTIYGPSSRSGNDGTYSISGVAPGKYRVIAINPADAVPLNDILDEDSNDSADVVEVHERETVTKDLRVRASENAP